MTRWLEQASQLIHVSRLDEAESLLQRCLRPPWDRKRCAVMHAHLRLSTVASHRGDHETALSKRGSRQRMFSEYPPQPQFLSLARYQSPCAGVAGQTKPMRVVTLRRSRIRLRVTICAHFYVTELYLALGDGQIPFLDGPLWDRAQLALDTDHAPPLLGLCAWGF